MRAESEGPNCHIAPSFLNRDSQYSVIEV